MSPVLSATLVTNEISPKEVQPNIPQSPGKNDITYKESDSQGLPQKSETGVSHDKSQSQSEDTSDPSQTPTKHWKELTTFQKVVQVSLKLGKFLTLILTMYFFVCSLDLLSAGFRLVGHGHTDNLIKNASLFRNPMVGCILGILVTALVQSSSTTTSIIVGLVSSKILTVKMAIPFVMGANIGTSITSALVSFGQVGNRKQFQLAFAAACVHDSFNWMTVVVLLPVEFYTGYLYELSGVLVNHTVKWNRRSNSQMLSFIVKPLVKKIIQIDSDCDRHSNATKCEESIIKDKKFCKSSRNTTTKYQSSCSSLFAQVKLRDSVIGALIIAFSILLLIICLLVTVKVLQSMLKGKLAHIVKRTVNSNIPYVPWLTGYIAIVVGAVMTMLLQSSSVFTSALTPLVGLGVITIERVYPLTLGSNIGTTITAILASLSVERQSFNLAFQIAMCHLLFNMTGILLFYPIPFMRIPIKSAKFLGRETAKYRWFAVAYILSLFVILPFVVLALSLIGHKFFMAFMSSTVIIIIIISIINILQNRKSNWLPPILRTWKWLPKPLRSLQPYDKFLQRSTCCCRKKQTKQTSPTKLSADSSDQDMVNNTDDVAVVTTTEENEKEQASISKETHVEILED